MGSREDAKARRGLHVMLNVEELCTTVIDTGLHIHKDFGPGLLETFYEQILAAKLERMGLMVTRQKPINIVYQDVEIKNAFRIDLLINDLLVVEIKSVEQLASVHKKQLLTYLRLTKLSLGLLINFGGPTFKSGIKRVVNNHTNFASSRLRVNQMS
jgi:GxxExxY protein